MNTLQSIFGKTAHSTPATINLPNGGGSYQYPSVFQGVQTPQSQRITPPPVVEQPVVNQQLPVNNEQPTRSKYINPETGKYFTPQEYANSVAMKIPLGKGTGDVPQTAGDAMMNPNESAEDLTTRVTNLNNTRNDIATGTTDPYGVGNKSGIAYSPQELAAIEKAYAGIYDPALNDVFARLKTKEDEAKAIQDREDKIFSTNESIRQWKETTGTKSGSSGDDTVNISDAAVLDGASRAGMTPENFKTLDPVIQNYYVNRPKSYNPETEEFDYIDETFELLLSAIEAGDMTSAEVAEKIMKGKNLDDTVKLYLIGLLPRDKEIPFDATKLGIALNTVKGIPQAIKELFPF